MFGKLLTAKLLHNTLPRRVVDNDTCIYQNAFVNAIFNDLDNDPWLIENGTRQGSILSLLLFSSIKTKYRASLLKSTSI